VEGKVQMCGQRVGGFSIKRRASNGLSALSNTGLLVSIVGMFTDSRSFMSLQGTNTVGAFWQSAGRDG